MNILKIILCVIAWICFFSYHKYKNENETLAFIFIGLEALCLLPMFFI